MSAQPENFVPELRAMCSADLDSVAAIENSIYTFPWGRGVFSDCLIAGYPCFVLEIDDTVVGYAIMSVAAAEGHILNLCIAARLQRQGLGQRLLDRLLELSNELQIERLFLEVRPSNTAAVNLYETNSFIHLGIRKGYYKAAEGREDALVLLRDFLAESKT
jgi:ribosomal-protein-alanine N-acetyltransferase